MQEVIVYRSPVEAAIYQMLMSGEFFALLCGVVVFFLVLVGTHKVLWKLYRLTDQQCSKCALSIGAVAGIAVAAFMLSRI